METNIIYNADCLEKLKELPDESIDAIITDPPYERHQTKWITALESRRSAFKRKIRLAENRIKKLNRQISALKRFI